MTRTPTAWAVAWLSCFSSITPAAFSPDVVRILDQKSPMLNREEADGSIFTDMVEVFAPCSPCLSRDGLVGSRLASIEKRPVSDNGGFEREASRCKP
jgi:hypothetical protein